MKKSRNSNIEFARIISMFLIVLGHFAWQTHWNFSHVTVLNQSAIQYLWFGGKLGVDIFVLISAYFLCQRTDISWRSLKRLWAQVLCYSVVLSLTAVLVFHVPINMKDLIKTLFPVITGSYWFVTAYVILVLISPYINILLANLSKKQFHQLLVTLCGVFFIASITQTQSIGFQVDEAATIIGLYPFGAYLRIYQDDIKKLGSHKLIAIIIVLQVLLFGSALIINEVNRMIPSILNSRFAFARFFGSTSPLQLFSAIAIVQLCIEVPEKNNELINHIASAVFGVYLFHCHPMMISLIWNQFVNANQFVHSGFIFLYAIEVSSIIFLIGIIFDFIRQFLFMTLGLLLTKTPDKNYPFK